MGKLFDLDSPLMRFLNRMADLLWLNFLTLLLVIPVVTAGAAFTALHFTCLKLVRGEEGYITKDYFRSFKQNFGQATIIWLIALLTAGILVFDFWYMFFSGEVEKVNTFVSAGLMVAAVLYIFTLVFIFPVQSHFINPVRKTIKNAFLLSMMVLPRTLLMLLLWVVPALVMYFIQPAFLLTILFWFSVPAYFGAMIYNKTFKRFEPEQKDTNDDFTWSVSSDEDGASVEEDAHTEEENTLAEDEKGDLTGGGRAGSDGSADGEG